MACLKRVGGKGENSPVGRLIREDHLGQSATFQFFIGQKGAVNQISQRESFLSSSVPSRRSWSPDSLLRNSHVTFYFLNITQNTKLFRYLTNYSFYKLENIQQKCPSSKSNQKDVNISKTNTRNHFNNFTKCILAYTKYF